MTKTAGTWTEDSTAPLVSLSDISEIELRILRRMREVTSGDHDSQTHGTGFDYVGLRDWQAGDRFSSIDWPQSTLNNFSPMIVREYEQPSTAALVAVADASRSTLCGVQGAPIASAIAWAVATLGMSAVFFQDQFGLVTFGASPDELQTIQPRVGKSQVVHCLDAYQFQRGLEEVRHAGSLSQSLASLLRRTAMVPFISDFLFDDSEHVLRELSLLATTHDVFIVLIDSAFAYVMPDCSAGWIDVVDVETGRSRTLSRRAARDLARKVSEWQDDIVRQARDLDLDVVRLRPDVDARELVLAEFVAERRLRKVS